MDLESSIKFIISSDFENFAEIEANKLLRVFEISSGKEFTMTLDSESATATSAAFGKIQNAGKTVLAIGDEHGSIRLYNFKTRSVEAELSEHVSRVLDLRIREESNSLYSVSADKKIIQWDLTTMNTVDSIDLDRKGKANEIKIDFVKDDVHLLVSLDNKIVLYNTQSKKPEKKFKGHPTNVNFLSATKEPSNYFASISNEDAINIWNVENENPVFSVAIPSQVYLGLDFCKVSKGYFLFVAHSNSSLRLGLLKVTKSNISLVGEAIVPFQDRDLLSAKIYNKRYVMLAVIQDRKPKFHIVSLFPDEESVEMKSQQKIIDDINATINKGFVPADANNKKSKNKDLNNDFHVAGEAEDVSNRFKKLNGVKITDNGLEQAQDDYFILDKLVETQNQPAEGMDSLAVVLFQALHNNDVQLLDYCFQNEDEDLIENTLKKLQQTKVLALIDKIIERLDSQKNTFNIMVWLKYLLKHHASFLITKTETVNKLAPLVAMLEKRTINYDKIYKLKGKLDMMLDINETVRKQKKKQKKLNIEQKPLVVYEEGEVEKPVERPRRKLSQTIGYTTAMQELEEREEKKGDEQKEFSDSVSVSEEEMDDKEFDTYLHAGEDDYSEEDDDKESGDSYMAFE